MTSSKPAVKLVLQDATSIQSLPREPRPNPIPFFKKRCSNYNQVWTEMCAILLCPVPPRVAATSRSVLRSPSPLLSNDDDASAQEKDPPPDQSNLSSGLSRQSSPQDRERPSLMSGDVPKNRLSSSSPKMQRQPPPKVGKGVLYLRPIFSLFDL